MTRECTCPRPEPNGDITAYRNVGEEQWGYCVEHCRRWLIGSRIFSSWLYEDESTWEHNRTFLQRFEIVDPFECVPDYLRAEIDAL